MMNRKTAAAALSIASNTTLIIIKLIVGVISGSVSIISEAIHSGMDLFAALIAFIAVKKADVPPDDHHPYGHDKVENVSGVLEAILILIASGWIIFEAVVKLFHPSPVEQLGLGFLVFIEVHLDKTTPDAFERFARAVRLAPEVLDAGSRLAHRVGQLPDALLGLADHLLAAGDSAVGLLGGGRRGFGVARHFMDGGGHLVHRRGHLFGFRPLAVDSQAGARGNAGPCPALH